MRGVFQKTAKGFAPAGPSGREVFDSVKPDQIVVLRVVFSRSPEQLNKFWALVTLVAEADDVTKDSVKESLLRQTGYVDCSFDPDGKMHVRTKSIAMDAMEQDEFDRFFKAAVEIMAERLGTKRADLRDRFNEIMKGRRE